VPLQTLKDSEEINNYKDKKKLPTNNSKGLKTFLITIKVNLMNYLLF